MKRVWKITALAVLSLGVVGAAVYGGIKSASPQKQETVEAPPTVPVSRGDVRQSVSASGQLAGTHQENLRMGVEGSLAEVKVRPGDEVKTGDLLATINGKEKFESELASAQLAALQAQKELEDLLAAAPKSAADARLALLDAQQKLEEAQKKREALKYPRASQARLDNAYAAYREAQYSLALSQSDFEQVAAIDHDDPRWISALSSLSGAVTQRDSALATYNWLSGKPSDADISQADAQVSKTKAEVEQAKRAWEQVKDGPESTALKAARAKVDVQEARRQEAQAALAHLELRAPFTGVILEVKFSAGDKVTADDVVAVLTDPDAVEAQVTVVEEDYGLIQPGQAVELYLDSQPDAKITGKVARKIPKRSSTERPVYPVYISLDQSPQGLAAGMSADASIAIQTRTNVLLLPKVLVRARGDGSAQVEVWTNNRKEKREIKIGLIGDQNVEILEGLAEGELVVGK